MSLCTECQLIPVRKILRLQGGDKSLQAEFYIWKDPTLPWDSGQPFHKWHLSLQQLHAHANTCSLCRLATECLQSSNRFTANAVPGDERGVWLRISPNNWHLHVFLGDDEPEVLVSGRLLYTVTPDSPVAKYLKALTVIPDALHPAVLGKIDRWLEVCSNKHLHCSQKLGKEGALPTRLLDLGSLPRRLEIGHAGNDWHALFDAGSCKLIETSGILGKYVALSYCWGTSLPYTTTTQNLQIHMQDGGIKFTQLPRTLQDAAFLVRYLGFRYLWADCLCIVQDDKADWERESSLMADVYSNAAVTLAAMRASHCDEGFLQPRSAKQRTLVDFEDNSGRFSLYFEYKEDTMSPGAPVTTLEAYPLRQQRSEPMMDRVWCYQERVLANRIVHFTQQEMYWECRDGLFWESWNRDERIDNYDEYSVEAISDGLVQALLCTGSDFEVWRKRKPWFDAVKEYTSRNITYPSDKLPALSGIISALQITTNDICHAGIWRSWFLQGLLWSFQDPDLDVYISAPKKTHSVGQWRAPSWSFAAIEGVVLYNHFESYGLPCARFEDCSIVPKGSNPLGEIQSGYARLAGPLTRLVNITRAPSINGRECDAMSRDQSRIRATVRFDLEYVESCEVLLITPYAGLAIVPVEDKTQTYIRVGIVTAYRDDRERDGNGMVVFGPSLTAASWPEPTTVFLL